MTVGDPEEAHEVAPKERLSREDDIANDALGAISAHEAVMAAHGRSEDLAFSAV